MAQSLAYSRESDLPSVNGSAAASFTSPYTHAHTSRTHTSTDTNARPFIITHPHTASSSAQRCVANS